MIIINLNEERLIQNLCNDISIILDSVGLFYRIFHRLKSSNSLEKKIESKREDYKSKGKRLQDLFGIRVTVYFADDEPIAISLIKKNYEELAGDHSIDTHQNERFGPQRCNLIFRLPPSIISQSDIFGNEDIDSTFEVQFRSVFSEGWHEIEHDLRYKCQADWNTEKILSRQLNSQAAVLESCDWTILRIFDEMAYKKYKDSEWSSFFRNVMRIRFADESFSDATIKFLNKNKELAKQLIKKDRENLIMPISMLSTRIPLKMDTVLFIVNRFTLKNNLLYLLEPDLIKNILDISLSNSGAIF